MAALHPRRILLRSTFEVGGCVLRLWACLSVCEHLPNDWPLLSYLVVSILGEFGYFFITFIKKYLVFLRLGRGEDFFVKEGKKSKYFTGFQRLMVDKPAG